MESIRIKNSGLIIMNQIGTMKQSWKQQIHMIMKEMTQQKLKNGLLLRKIKLGKKDNKK